MKSLIITLCAASLLSGCSANVNKPTPQSSTQPQASTTECAGTFIKAINLASGSTLVVTEGRLEPRSIGSASVKLYRDLYVGDFVGAVSFVRDGTILKAVLIENGTDKQKLSITTVTAGSGNYQNTQLVCITGDSISLC